MTDARYFDEDASDAGLVDSDERDMARRQFGVSLVVAFALMAVAAVTAMENIRKAPVERTVRHKIIRIEAPRIEVAEPALDPAIKG
jgi:hypothetical protein